jgi:hypothetical protein
MYIKPDCDSLGPQTCNLLSTGQCYAKKYSYLKVKIKQSRYRLEWPRGFQEVKVKQSRYRPGVAQRVPGS